jgi:EAL domain-containing protein (putative c-di-GMP-specific phosphodiesterase class I)
MEALIRWQHPKLGLLTAEHFMDMAIKNGLIIEIGQWVLQSACSQIQAWYQEGYNPGKMAVNLGALELDNRELVPFVSDTLYRTGCKASWLELEMSDDDLNGATQLSLENLNALDKLGIDISIDDFGTASTSLNYLKQLPITSLKIDGSLTQKKSSDDQTILEAIIALGQVMGLNTIAEGIESEAQKTLLQEKGCSVMQGHHFSKAVDASEIKMMLPQQNRKSE